MKLIKLIPYIIIAFLLVRIVHLNKQNTVLIDKTATLEENLKKQVVIYKDKIVYKERVSGTEVSGTNVKQETIYVPNEGKIEILTPEESQKLDLGLVDKIFNHIIKQEDGSIIMVQTRGFCFAPEIAGLYSSKVEVGLQAKLVFWGRYGAGIGITNEETIYGFANRNISDILPVLSNSSLQVGLGKNIKDGENKFLFGLSVRL